MSKYTGAKSKIKDLSVNYAIGVLGEEGYYCRVCGRKFSTFGSEHYLEGALALLVEHIHEDKHYRDPDVAPSNISFPRFMKFVKSYESWIRKLSR